MNTAIRAATAADSAALARLRYEFRVALNPSIEDRDAFVRRCRDWMAERLGADRAWRCWIAERDGEAVGQVWLHVLEKVPNPVAEPEAHAYITNMYVRDGHRGEGIGARLLTRALEWCRERGDIHAVILWPTDRSRSLYLRHGFIVRDDVLELVLRLAAGRTVRRAYPRERRPRRQPEDGNMRRRISGLVAKHPIAGFLVLTLLISWTCVVDFAVMPLHAVHNAFLTAMPDAWQSRLAVSAGEPVADLRIHFIASLWAVALLVWWSYRGHGRITVDERGRLPQEQPA